MKKIILIALGIIVTLSACTSYNAAAGAATGGEFGHIIGSTVGGISGGWRGSQWGSLIGTVGGIAAGAAIGSAIDKKETAKREQAQTGQQPKQQKRQQQAKEQPKQQPRQQQTKQQQTRQQGDSGFDPEGRGDDRIVFYNEQPALQIRHAGLYESVSDGVLTRSEECTVVFEIYNNTDAAVFDIRPLVEDVTGNKHIKISPNLRVESIDAHKGIRYTATILADKKLKDGEIVVRVGVAHGENEIESERQEFTVPTAK